MKNDYKMRAGQRKLIQKIKKQIKKEESFLGKCKEYNRDPSFVDDVKIDFKPLDVSAKTVNGDVIINEQLLEKGDWDDIMRYVTHELCHVLQQEAGKVDGVTDKEDYLKDENEVEAFGVQVEYMDEHVPEKELQEYLEDLLDHHGVEGKERKKILRDLTKDI
jgi:hypothetical protein